MENSLLANFDEIWPKTMYYSTGSLTRFWSNFKNSDRYYMLSGILTKEAILYMFLKLIIKLLGNAEQCSCV